MPLVGTVTVQPRISVKAALGDPWTDFSLGSSSAFATNFRYAKFRLEFASLASGALGQYGVLQCSGFNARLSTEKKSQSGTATSDLTAGGTAVAFGGFPAFDVPPVVQISAESSTFANAQIDPGSVTKTGFKFYVFDAAGMRMNGVKVNWSADQSA
jgi:hypothetical protein